MDKMKRTGQTLPQGSGQELNQDLGPDLDQSAVQAAMELFWAEGAEVASYNDIVSVTGLSRNALYRRWPDKDALIRDTLAHYDRQLRQYALAPLEQGGRDGLVSFWDVFEEAARRRGWNGCYLFRTASGPLRSRTYVGAAMSRYLDEFTEKISAEIMVARRNGDIPVTIDPDTAKYQAFALAGLISVMGATHGYCKPMDDLFAAARASCGV
jgi:TetR/AcrR family transcriptional regulator, transcriptional repressor for nem operon